MYRLFNSRGQNDAAYPSVALQIQADYLELWNPATGTVHIEVAPPQIQCAINNGPFAGYRDQAAPFPASADVFFYWIWGVGPGLSTISSLAAPPQGPALPVGFTNYALATVLTLAGGTLQNVIFRGKKVFYPGTTTAYNPDNLPDPGDAEQFFSAAPWVPAIAQDFTLEIDSQIVSQNGCGGSALNRIGVRSGQYSTIHECLTPPAGAGLPGASAIDASYAFPNVSRGVYWDWYDFAFFSPNGVQHRWMTLYVLGYSLP